MDTSGTKHIRQIVLLAMDLADVPDHHYDKYFNLAMKAVKKLRLRYVREGEETTKLTVDTTLGTVDFPDDMQDYIGIAIVVNGEYKYLTRRDDLNITTTETDGEEGYDSDIGEGEDVLDYYWDGFATRGGMNVDGYYYPDYKNDRFVLRNINVTQVWLKYITSGITLDSTSHYFPERYEDTIITYIVWQANRLRKDVPRSYKEDLKREYMDEVMELKNSEWGTLQELDDALASLIHNSVRR